MRQACVLVVAGVDPGGGAGIAADVRAVRAAGAFACPVVATLTVQSTSGLVAQRAVGAALVVRQARAVLDEQRVCVVKTGALGSARNVSAIARLLRDRALPLVVDPVRLPSRGRAALLDEVGFDHLRRELLPLATIVTANVDEAARLTGTAVDNVRSARIAALALVELGARAALVKGGHLSGRAVDVLAVGTTVVLLDAPRLKIGAIHGGGCTLSSLIAGRLAILYKKERGQRERAFVPSDRALVEAVRWSKAAHHSALRNRLVNVGGAASVLDV